MKKPAVIGQRLFGPFPYPLAAKFGPYKPDMAVYPFNRQKPDRQFKQSPAGRTHPFRKLPRPTPGVPTYILSREPIHHTDLDMVAAFQFEDFERALAAGLTNLTEDQILAVKEFVKQVGGIENARLAIESLENVKPAA